MSIIILKTNGTKSVLGILILWVLPPLTIIAFLSSINKPTIWLFLIPFLITAILIIYFKAYRIEVYKDKIFKVFLLRKKRIERSSSKIKFRLGGYKESRGNPIVIINSGSELIGTIEFNSFSKLEKFVEQTLKEGDSYVWNKTIGKGDVYDKTRYLINKYQQDLRV